MYSKLCSRYKTSNIRIPQHPIVPEENIDTLDPNSFSLIRYVKAKGVVGMSIRERLNRGKSRKASWKREI